MDELRRTRVSSGDVELLQQGVRGWVLPRCRVHRHVLRGYVRFLGRMFGVLRGHTHLQRRERVLDAVVSSPFFTLYESSLSLLLLLLLLLLVVVVVVVVVFASCRHSDSDYSSNYFITPSPPSPPPPTNILPLNPNLPYTT